MAQANVIIEIDLYTKQTEEELESMYEKMFNAEHVEVEATVWG